MTPGARRRDRTPLWLRAAAVLLPTTAVVALLLIAAGAFDPQPLGPLTQQRALPSLTLPAQTDQIIWLDEPLSALPLSVRLTAAYAEGESDVGYGLALGDETAYLAAAVSPLGYVAVWEIVDGRRVAHVPWQPWPHVRPGAAPNEVWIDWRDGRARVRLNRELLWEGEITVDDGRVGLVGESFGDAAVVDFRTLELFRAGAGAVLRKNVASYCVRSFRTTA